MTAETYQEKYPATLELLDQIHQHTVEQAQAIERAAKRARKFPGEVDKCLVLLAEKLADQERRVSALEARFPEKD